MESMRRCCWWGGSRVWIILSLYSLSSNAHSHWSQILIHPKPVLMFYKTVKTTQVMSKREAIFKVNQLW